MSPPVGPPAGVAVIDEFGEWVEDRNRPHMQEFANSAHPNSANCGAIAWAWNGDGSAGNMNADGRLDYLN